MSYSQKRCPECKESISYNANNCNCGWKNKDFSQGVPDFLIRCSNFNCQETGLSKVIRVNEKDYLCNAHWEDFILRNQQNPAYENQARRILVERHLIQEAKDLGISNCEYFKTHGADWGGVKSKLLGLSESGL